MLQSISNEYLAAPNSQTPLKTSYGGFKEMESVNSGRSNGKYRPSSSDRSKLFKYKQVIGNLNVDDTETDAASKMLPSLKVNFQFLIIIESK